MLENKIVEYLEKHLEGKIECKFDKSKDIDRYYDTMNIKQETMNNILVYTICYDHRWEFEKVKEKIDRNIIGSIMNRFLVGGKI